MKYKVTLNGRTYEVEVNNGQAILLDEYEAVAAAPAAPAAAPAANVEGTKVTAPMPGTILDIKVKVGDEVSEGQVLLILEAMKMENDIPATKGGKVAAINVNKGDTVNSNDVLVVIQ